MSNAPPNTLPRRIIPYAPWLVPIARRLRNNSTLSEILLWQHLKGKQIFGYDFHRQRPVDRYIIDFFCVELMLAIEIDGSSHEIDGQWTKDSKRQMRLEKFGIHFLRFDDLAVKKDAEEVARVIAQWVQEHQLN